MLFFLALLRLLLLLVLGRHYIKWLIEYELQLQYKYPNVVSVEVKYGR